MTVLNLVRMRLEWAFYNTIDTVQVLGELRVSTDAGGTMVYLLARVCRLVPDLDTVLFERAALARRAFLQKDKAST